MTDDISKVEACDVCGGAGYTMRPSGQTTCWKCSAIESATTPAEVDGEAASDDSIIARCEAVGIKWLEPDNVLPDGTIDLEGFPGSFDMATMQEMRALLADYATLARQLAEAKERMRELEAQRDDYLNREWVAEKAKRKAESQLAEATRRLGEVEGLVGKWRGIAHEYRYNPAAMPRTAHHYEACADELEAALTKEPTK